jgi:hypothetical protein
MHLESDMVSAAKPVSILRNGGIMRDEASYCEDMPLTLTRRPYPEKT